MPPSIIIGPPPRRPSIDIISLPPAMTRSSRARHDRGRRHVDAGDAEPQKRSSVTRARAHLVAGIERRHAPEIAALRRDLRAAAPDDVVDIGGVDAGAIDERPQHGRTQLLRMNARERPLPALPTPRGVRQASMMSASAIGVVLLFTSVEDGVKAGDEGSQRAVPDPLSAKLSTPCKTKVPRRGNLAKRLIRRLNATTPPLAVRAKTCQTRGEDITPLPRRVLRDHVAVEAGAEFWRKEPGCRN